MKDWIEENPMTFMLVLAFMLVVIVGGVVVIVEGENTLSFEDYLNNLTKFALAVGIFGAGRAVKNGILGTDADDASGEPDNVPDEEELRQTFPEDPAPVPEGDPSKFKPE